MKNGLISGKRYLSLAELKANSERVATGFHALGISPGDKVALLLRNDFAYFEASLGASIVGVCPVPINWHMSVLEISHILRDSEAKLLVVHADLLSEEVFEICENIEVIVVETPDEVVTAYALRQETCLAPKETRKWSSWINSFDKWKVAPLKVTSPIFYTSGTTGLPKGVVRELDSITKKAMMEAQDRSMHAWGLDANEPKSIMTGPMYHSAPNAYAMGVVRKEGLLVLQSRFGAEELLFLIERFQITHLHMVPTMFSRLLKLPREERLKFDLSSLLHVAHGAAPCSDEVKDQMIEWFGKKIFEYYAMTETGIIACCDSEEWLSHKGTVGRAADGVDIRIVDKSGKNCGPNIPGQICISSEISSHVSYRNAEEKTRALRLDDYIATGDVGYLNEEGYLFISDRLSDMIISGGVNIYPAEIEKALTEFPKINDCAVFGVPDLDLGEKVIAVIDAEGKISDKDIKIFLRKRVSQEKIPKEIIFDSTLPREDSGKIKKRLLREAYKARSIN